LLSLLLSLLLFPLFPESTYGGIYRAEPEDY
jgi:hypothetical protein